MGGCINTPGSFKCDCPDGYELQSDGRTCLGNLFKKYFTKYHLKRIFITDIDECQRGECQGNEKICVNTLGSFKCHRIKCPLNYAHDKNYKKYIFSIAVNSPLLNNYGRNVSIKQLQLLFYSVKSLLIQFLILH